MKTYKTNHRNCVLACLIAVLGSACIPEHLRKYRGKDASAAKTKAPTTGPATDMDQTPQARRVSSVSARQPERPSIYAVDEKTFRFSLPRDQVWEAALNVLLRNYNLTIVDQDSGVITTEWDTFYLDQSVFRNKMSLRIQKNSRSSCDLMVHNSVEKLQDAAPAGAVGAVWLPAQDQGNEVHRIIRNMAIVLNQPPPYLPTGSVARGAGGNSVN